MSVKIRLQRHGSKKRPFYYIVVANSTSTRDGRFIEKLGTYNPLTIPATVNLDRERSLYWLDQGAQPTNTCRRILSFKGVLFLKHLMRGVKMELFDQEAAMQKFEKWNVEHEQLVIDREETHRKHKAEKRKASSDESVRMIEEKQAAKKAAATPEPVEEVATEAAEESAAPVVEEAVATDTAETPESPAADQATDEATPEA